MSKAKVTAGFSPEIQALRALAVVSVVIFHFWPNLLPGGYAGVDVFFVISGFLITSHLLREIRRSGNIDLRRFWARRIRRLFPAALLVLGVTLAASVILLPAPRWQQVITQFWSCLGLVQNWTLGYSATNYFTVDSNVSPLQHYWSLSVEEQFYLVWPILLVVSALIARKFTRARPVRAFALVAALLGVASFIYSIIETDASQAFAYFSTLTHVWEFVAGGLLACISIPLGAAMASRRALHSPLVLGAALVVGVLLIVIPDFRFTGATLFPGWIAIIPTTGTLLVLVVSIVGAPGFLARVVAFRPIGFTGDISYSLYLWHWPLIVLAPTIFGSPIGVAIKLPLLALTFALAWLSKVAVEDPIRRGPLSRVAPRWSYAAGAALVATSIAIAAIPYASFERQLSNATAQSRALVAEHSAIAPNCYAAGAVLRPDPASCPNSHQLDPRELKVSQWLGLIPDPTAGQWSANWTSCPTARSAKLAPCNFGPANAKLNIAVVGDSHGFEWGDAILPLAQRYQWHASINWFAGCGILAPGPDIGHIGDGENGPGCISWENSIIQNLVSDRSIDVVVMSSYTQKFAHGGTPNIAGIRTAYANAFNQILASGKHIVVVADTPLPQFNVPDCLAQTKVVVDPCVTPVAFALHEDPMAEAALSITSSNIQVVDLHGLFCDTVCHSVIGGVPAYKDGQHLSTPFLVSLAPVFDPILSALARTY